jgi:hypothetical protein
MLPPQGSIGRGHMIVAFGQLHLSPRRWFTHALHSSQWWATSGYTRAAGCHGENSGYEGAVIDIGASLAEARVLRGLEIDDAANQTRLRAYYLHALEREEFEQLPPGSYRRAFLRTYAAFLDLDADLLVQEYVARYEHARPRT